MCFEYGVIIAQHLTIADVIVQPGETASMTIQLDPEQGNYTGLEFDILFPQNGFSTTGNATTIAAWNGAFTIGNVGGVGIDNLARCGVLSYSDMPIPNEGMIPLGTVEFIVPEALPKGEYIVKLTNMTLIGEGRTPVEDASFTMQVVSNDGLSLPYESFIVNNIGYKILTENTVAVTDRAQYPLENVTAPISTNAPLGSPSEQSQRKSPLIEYIYTKISYSGKMTIPATVTYDGITYMVTEIDDSAFPGSNSWVTSLTIPYTVTYLGSCSNTLTELIIEDGDTEIKIAGSMYSIFYRKSLETLYLGRNIVGYNFGMALKEVTIGDHVTSLPSSCFQSCNQLSAVHFGPNITSIGEKTFQNCSALTEIDLSGKLSVIPETSFYGCIALENVILPQGLTSIEARAFYGCTSLKNINLPSTLQSIGNFAFRETAFTQISIPSSVNVMDETAFNDCSLLKDIVIEDGDTELAISDRLVSPAFDGCPLDSIYVGRHIVREGSTVTADICNSVRAIAFGDKVTRLGGWNYLTNLTSVYLGKNISYMGLDDGFKRCSSLRYIDLTSNLTVLTSGAFEDCTALESVILPAGLITLNEKVFKGCTSLQSITIPEQVTYLGSQLFDGCSSLESFIIPKNVTRIAKNAFIGCTSLTDVVFEDDEKELTIERENFRYPFTDSPLDSVYMGRTMRYEYHDGYKWVEISHRNSSGENVFPDCLKKISFGVYSSLGNFPYLSNATNLMHIYPKWEEPITFDHNRFADNVYTNATLIVPCGTAKKYRTTSAWKDFANIMPISISVTMTATAGGSLKLDDEVVSDDTRQLELKPNNVLTFEVMVEDDYFLESVMVNGVDVTAQVVNGKLTLSDLSDDSEIVATFTPKPYYDVLVTSSAGGTVTVSNPSVMWGLSTTITLTTDEGYELTSVTVNGVEKKSELVDGVLTLNDIMENKTIVVTFHKLTFEITASAGDGGSIQLSSILPEWGDDVTVTITPAPHYQIDKVLVNGEDRTSALVDNVLTLQNVKNAMSIEATFCIQTFTVSASVNKGGYAMLSLAGSDETDTSVIARWGSNVTINLTAEEDYELVGLFVNGVDVTEQIVNDSYVIASVEDDLTIEAVFREIMEITLMDGQNYSRSRDKQYERLHYSRLFKNTEWDAWYVPFDMTLTSDLLARFSFAKFAGTYTEDDGSFCITVVRLKEGDVVKANTPYCVQAKVADAMIPQVITQADVTLKEAEESNFFMLTAEKKITFCGNYTSRSVTEDEQNWYVLSGGQYSKQLPGNTIAPFRCFITIEDRDDNPYSTTPNPANVKLMVLGDDETGIDLIDNEQWRIDHEADSWYTLDGKKLNGKPATKGIFIRNGKKVLLK